MAEIPPPVLSIEIPEITYDKSYNENTPNTYSNTYLNTYSNTYSNMYSSYNLENFDFNNLSLDHPIYEIYLDMDETIGHVSASSIFFNIWHHFNPNQIYPNYSDFKWFFEQGAFRPGLIELLQYLVELKNKGLIKYISIYTAASNHNNYVDWIVRSMEEYSGIPKYSIDSIYDRENCIHNSYSGIYYKNIQNNAILIDDNPWYSSKPNRTLGVKPYKQYVDSKPLYDLFDTSNHKKIHETLEYDYFNYRPSTEDYSGDRELFRIINGLKQIFE